MVRRAAPVASAVVLAAGAFAFPGAAEAKKPWLSRAAAVEEARELADSWASAYYAGSPWVVRWEATTERASEAERLARNMVDVDTEFSLWRLDDAGVTCGLVARVILRRRWGLVSGAIGFDPDTACVEFPPPV